MFKGYICFLSEENIAVFRFNPLHDVLHFACVWAESSDVIDNNGHVVVILTFTVIILISYKAALLVDLVKYLFVRLGFVILVCWCV
jgi:hypothetical protein